MENRKRIIELLTTVRYTTNDIEKVADEIYLLFDVVGQSEQLKEISDLQDFAFEVCPLHREDDLHDILIRI